MDDTDFIPLEGVYESFADARAKGEGFAGEKWSELSHQRTAALLAANDKETAIPISVSTHDYILPTVVGMLLGSHDKVRVLDFGGGPGNTIPGTLGGLEESERVEVNIVEMSDVCDIGRDLYQGWDNVHFSSKLPDRDQEVELIHLGSSLQYIDDWAALIKDLRDYNPKYLLLSDVPAGNIPTFVTLQYFYGAQIKRWFWNLDELTAEIGAQGFELVLKTNYISKYLGKSQLIPMDNFPKDHQLRHPCHLLFKTA
ncbi:MAG: methyltransferase, TIGR04325 family [Rhodospirillaceae bacterium]|nr:methyltransferase, TIGR04325 family [Rhodospirillaceae bacterium]MBT4220485.1 methyltransferase, TIGR04325 family [Rhodospirillaceae bacterium]MBT4464426.1 methyltransferase, TIGR04325 family [Rhodospirillaceae bacterium]MBT5014534.1 methyltransferase, TIGR04325 family [Rhodospirillaceae bacterium]MBT5309507.1 methyltransferase, TIGR04325 family [Rhodospirillaceae bacterium]